MRSVPIYTRESCGESSNNGLCREGTLRENDSTSAWYGVRVRVPGGASCTVRVSAYGSCSGTNNKCDALRWTHHEPEPTRSSRRARRKDSRAERRCTAALGVVVASLRVGQHSGPRVPRMPGLPWYPDQLRVPDKPIYGKQLAKLGACRRNSHAVKLLPGAGAVTSTAGVCTILES